MITRREWLSTAAAVAAGVAGSRLHAATGATPAADTPILRPIPSSGETLPVIGLGTNN